MNSMLYLVALFLAPEIAPHSGQDRDAKREAKDLVVFGKVESQEYGEALDDLGMNSMMTARLRITRVVNGHAPSSVIKIRYVTHSSLSEDGELRFRLRPSDDGTYLVCSEGGRGFVCR